MQLQLTKKLFGAGAKPEQDDPDELERVIAEFATEREAALNSIKALVPARTQALIDGDDKAINELDIENDRLHRAVERADLVGEQAAARLEKARTRVAAEADRKLRQQTSQKLNSMAAEFVRSAPEFKTALERFRAVAWVSEALGDVIGTVAATDALIRLVAEPDVIVSGLQARAQKVTSGNGPATYEGL